MALLKCQKVENRVTRAIIDSVLLFNRANPDTKTKGGKVGYEDGGLVYDLEKLGKKEK